MSETWKHTREGVARLRVSWANASQDSRHELFWWAVGLLMMAASIIAVFGGWGITFVVGFVFWKAMSP